MKTLILFAIASSALVAQTTGQLCYAPDKSVPAKTVCMDITPGMKASLTAFTATQQVQTGTDVNQQPIMVPKYQGIGDLIFSNLTSGLFSTLLDQFPTASVQTANAAITKATGDAATAKAAVFVKVSAPDPTTTAVIK
jgi:hypothetical protein